MKVSKKTLAVLVGIACIGCCAVPIVFALVAGGVFSLSFLTSQVIIIAIAGGLFTAALIVYLVKRHKHTTTPHSCDLNCECKNKEAI